MNHLELKEKYNACTLCASCQTGRKVYGAGNLKARIAIVGEGPGKDEAASLTPFVGAAGKLLNDILLGINLKREDLFFTNAVLCRTDDKNRTPTPEECLNCRNRLFEELSIVNPRYTILTGNTPLRTVFNQNYQIGKVHGQWMSTLTKPCFFYFPIYHPSWILHSVNEGEEKARKITMWKDIKKFAMDTQALDAHYDRTNGPHMDTGCLDR